MKISINCGHTLSGIGCGAIALKNESEETRVIGNKVIKLLREQGHTVYNHTVDYASSVTDSLKKIVNLVNNSDADLFVSIHFNASNGKGYGTEVYTYNAKPVKEASDILKEISNLGFNNRGIKNGSNLYVVRNTKPTAILIEVCFIDNVKDVEMYVNNVDNIAKAIVKGITGTEVLNDVEQAKHIIKSKIGLADETIQYLQSYKYGNDLLRKIANAIL